jgi:DNA-directed RNA polymerase omega subunit
MVWSRARAGRGAGENEGSMKAPLRTVDQAESKFRLVTLTAQRAKQLQNGARPRVDGGGHKFLRVALLEVMAGTVSWSLAEAVLPR